ncbi:ATP-binding cassette sub-family C member 4 [Diabrotica virgifera virgifera]|uniref:Multidrug resistance-associated protein 4-like isoform X1 n=3 Tax=Diabrotica virgifera virgifera TaxID=50390 RepID=A0A6P7F7Q0_DIAVI|nr:ATP-binding cassette sub-family C member 4 [Diabrotica virgifera virgifera]XP_028131529.1 ATP-binding cassette sub-family C member 4 [Diabrotica virgifera virgifera]XP_028131530.1 ATP-binding cassette sub-family C member 4 [Diabrotica virgifera virgifera]XP_028131531.1 ATP-binding cassette sub-family C member 4 [Diabrotica virgifera virgifera]XP_050516927.1 ATP-binding cassette sub-family C member 4 [Diabrotica virgifera virgifera]XP_050516928.1 ATP-binding cassette sub-family C member 4 [D
MEEVSFLEQKKRKRHPIETTNCVSKLFFCWLPVYLFRGLKNEVTEDDMYVTVEKQKSLYLGTKLEQAWKKQLKKKRPSLLLAIGSVFKWELAIYAVFNAWFELLRIAQPFLISKLVSYFQDGAKSDNIVVCAITLIIVTFAQVVSIHHYQLKVMVLGMKIRVAACALIYRKALKLSKTALSQTTVGQMVNLLSNDVGRFDYSGQHIHYLWLSPCVGIACAILLYKETGITGLSGSMFLLCFVPAQVYMAKLTSQFRLKTALKTDERIRLMNEIISGIQVIKMYTWEKPFAKLIEFIRKKEIDQIRHTSIIKALTITFNIALSRAAILVCILTYILSGNVLTASYAFTVTSYYTYMRAIITLQFPQAMTQFAETLVSISRIQKFLLFEELDVKYTPMHKQINNNEILQNNKPDVIEVRPVGIKIKNAAVKWIKKHPENTIEQINFEARSNQLVALVGPVGAGKSTLLQVILKELKPLEGTVKVTGTVSFASQEPWVFASSVRQNILFGETYNENKYYEVLRVCALEKDLKLFPHGDRTLIGERGTSLSGGQRARINLARAIYKEADIYLLDDPLSAVDTQVGKQIFNRCICNYLRKKCVVLVTHQLQYLYRAKFIYLIDDGRIRASGTFENLKNGDNAFTKLLATATEMDQLEHDRKLSKSESISSINYEEEDYISIDQQKETIGSGGVSWRVYGNYLKAGGNLFKTLILALSFVGTQVLVSLSDIFLTLWVNIEQWRRKQAVFINETSNSSNLDTILKYKDQSTESYWPHVMDQISPLHIYSFLVIATVILAVARSLASFSYFLTASTNVHNAMFRKIISSPMLFFNSNPSGRILNRFSKDIGILDELLPLATADSTWVGLTVVATTIVISLLNPWILIPTAVIVCIFYKIKQIFLVSSRNIKRIEAVTRSPIFTHLAASLQGLPTIRAFGAEQILTQEFDNFQDAYTSSYFMFLTASRGFGFWLDLHCAFYISLVVISIVFSQSDSLGGNVGLSLTQAITLSGMFQWVMREWSELENQMTSVERTQEYTDLPIESDNERKQPPADWPSSGSLTFKNMSLRYSLEAPCVLKNLNFEIKPREKIGIVGRTGAGKSSLIQALFRLAINEGSLIIDNVDINTVELKVLRSKISIIPQEPVLFSGTLRKNLDPFDDYSDKVLWAALDEVELKHAVEEMRHNLYGKMAEGGSNFSVGQRQLLCLARAIIRNNKILVLDEATANVDPMTDAIIQKTIREKFAECTVLTIAHRLNTVMDSNKVLVMNAGEAVEFDHPYTLLQNKKTIFYGLVRNTGKNMAAHLSDIAKQSYYNIHNSSSS